MILQNLISVGIGAILGAWFRYYLGFSLNHFFPTIPPGTVLCNLLGGLLIGIFIGMTKNHWIVSEPLRLFFVTGFLGSFTTFSTFSAETVYLLSSHEYFWSMVIILTHVGGSLIATWGGMFIIKLLGG